MNRQRLLRTTTIVSLLLMLTQLFSGQAVNAAAPLTIYGDSLSSGWINWSFESTLNFAATTPVHGGSKSLSVKYNAASAGVYLRGNSAVSFSYDMLRFWINGGAGTPQIKISFADQGNNWVFLKTVQAKAHTWMQFDVPLKFYATNKELWGIILQENGGGAQPTFYLDDIQLLTTYPIPPTFIFYVDAANGRYPISPYIYGMNDADPTLAADIKLPVNRLGGDSTTRYNYQLDTSNGGSDRYFENIPEDNSNPGALPDGSKADTFVAANKARGTDTVITLPMIGWSPRTREFACGFSVAKYGQQQAADPLHPDCGNGLNTDGTNLTGNDPTDTSLAISPAFVQGWIDHLKTQFGAADGGGVRFYNLDNEPMLWNSTHRDVHPTPMSYDELRDLTYQYASAIKASDPAAQTLGPVAWGWLSYFYSALDMAQPGDWLNNPIDRNAHLGADLTGWYLGQMKEYEQAHGVRILDYLDWHYYPAQAGIALSPAGNQATQDLRLRSTRSLWDWNYRDESEIADFINLIPRMRNLVDVWYPGTKLAITEYNFGAVEDINGALTEADVLGIFGREGLGLAAMSNPPTATQPAAYAFRMYRNYDGQGGMFGDLAVSVYSGAPDAVSIYAAQKPDTTMTIMVINKTTSDQGSILELSNFPATTAQLYRYSAANLNQIVRGADLSLIDNSLYVIYPAQSITLLVIPLHAVPPPVAPARNYFTTSWPTLTWNRVTWAAHYEVQISTDSAFTGAATLFVGNKLSLTWYLDDGSYHWRVRACSTEYVSTDDTCSAWSTPDTFVVDAMP